MKKLSKNWFLIQKIAIKREQICKKRSVYKSNYFNKSKSIMFPDLISFRDKTSREALLNAMEQIRKKQNPFDNETLFLDFLKVKTLFAPATIYFSHVLESNTRGKILSRSSTSSVVRAMMTKLGMDVRLGLLPCFSNHDMVDWYTFKGTDLTFGKAYDQIEKILEEKLDDETFLIVNDAISEAVSNVLNHAYEKRQRSLGWKVSLKVSDKQLSLVITDLGKSIPATVPDKIDDHVINRLSNVFDLTNLLSLDDAQLIDIASQFRRSSTLQKHRGKGFGDMLEVCKNVKGSKLIVYSRGGIWSSDGQKYKKMENFNNEINGTIIFWKLPLNSPSTSNCSEIDEEVGDGL